MLTKGHKKAAWSNIAYGYKYTKETNFCHPQLSFQYPVALILIVPLASNFFILTLHEHAWT